MIKKVELKKYGKFEGKKVSFPAPLSCIVGANESGKSTLLSAVADLYTGASREYEPRMGGEAAVGAEMSDGLYIFRTTAKGKDKATRRGVEESGLPETMSIQRSQLESVFYIRYDSLKLRSDFIQVASGLHESLVHPVSVLESLEEEMRKHKKSKRMGTLYRGLDQKKNELLAQKQELLRRHGELLEEVERHRHLESEYEKMKVRIDREEKAEQRRRLHLRKITDLIRRMDKLLPEMQAEMDRRELLARLYPNPQKAKTDTPALPSEEGIDAMLAELGRKEAERENAHARMERETLPPLVLKILSHREEMESLVSKTERSREKREEVEKEYVMHSRRLEEEMRRDGIRVERINRIVSVSVCLASAAAVFLFAFLLSLNGISLLPMVMLGGFLLLFLLSAGWIGTIGRMDFTSVSEWRGKLAETIARVFGYSPLSAEMSISVKDELQRGMDRLGEEISAAEHRLEEIYEAIGTRVGAYELQEAIREKHLLETRMTEWRGRIAQMESEILRLQTDLKFLKERTERDRNRITAFGSGDYELGVSRVLTNRKTLDALLHYNEYGYESKKVELHSLFQEVSTLEPSERLEEADVASPKEVYVALERIRSRFEQEKSVLEEEEDRQKGLLTSLHRDMNRMIQEKSSLQEKIGGADERELEDIDSRIMMVEEEMNEVLEKYALYSQLKEIVAESYAEFVSENQPTFIRNASEYLRFITQDRFLGFRIEEENIYMMERDGGLLRLEVEKASESKKSTKRFEGYRENGYYSFGTYSQILLCFKLAYADMIDSERKFPILLDDSISSWDDERLERGISLLRRISENRQIIYATCRPEIADKFEKILGSACLIKI